MPSFLFEWANRDVCSWQQADLPILHNHVRLAWQAGNHFEPSEHFRF